MPDNHSAQRFLSAIKELNSNGYIDSRKFKEINDIQSDRTLSRFFKDFKEFVPVKYDRKLKAYVKDYANKEFEEEIRDLFNCHRSDEELFFFISFVKSIIKSGGYLPPVGNSTDNEREYETVLRKLDKLIDPADASIHSKIEYHRATKKEPVSKVRIRRIFSDILKSFKTDRLIILKYLNKEEKIRPVRIINYSDRWYLAALKANGGEKKIPSVFEIDKIDRVVILSEYKDFYEKEPESSEFIKIIRSL